MTSLQYSRGGNMLDLRSTLFLRFRFLRAPRLLGVQGQSHVPRQVYQDPGHLYRSQVLEHDPFVLRNRDHHSPVSHRNLVGQVIPRHLLFGGLLAVDGAQRRLRAVYTCVAISPASWNQPMMSWRVTFSSASPKAS